MKTIIIRQGDVCLVKVAKLPIGCAEVPLENGRIVLMYGENTGHAHAIADHVDVSNETMANAIIDSALKLSARRARLLKAANGDRYLEVVKPVNLTHEEHTSHQIPPGIYKLPAQVEHDLSRQVRRVAD